jgi:toxin HigB-1
MIKTFASPATERFWATGKTRKLVPASLQRIALRKLWLVDRASELMDLSAPPAKRLEALKAERKGEFSIRINQQYRVCFRWEEGDAYDVEIVDYH